MTIVETHTGSPTSSAFQDSSSDSGVEMEMSLDPSRRFPRPFKLQNPNKTNAPADSSDKPRSSSERPREGVGGNGDGTRGSGSTGGAGSDTKASGEGKKKQLGSLVFDEDSHAFVSVKGRGFPPMPQEKFDNQGQPQASGSGFSGAQGSASTLPSAPTTATTRRDANDSCWWKRDPDEVIRMSQLKGASYVPPTPGQLPTPMRNITIPPYSRGATASADIDTIGQDVCTIPGLEDARGDGGGQFDFKDKEHMHQRHPLRPQTQAKGAARVTGPGDATAKDKDGAGMPRAADVQSRRARRGHMLDSFLTDEEILAFGSVEPWNEKVSDAFSEFHKQRHSGLALLPGYGSNTNGAGGGGGGGAAVLGLGGSFGGNSATGGFSSQGLGTRVSGPKLQWKKGESTTAPSQGFGSMPSAAGGSIQTGSVGAGANAVRRETISRRREVVEEVDLRQVKFDVAKERSEGNRSGELSPGEVNYVTREPDTDEPASERPREAVKAREIQKASPAVVAGSEGAKGAKQDAAQGTREGVGDDELVEEWRQQRLIATLTMRELRKIFPPLVQQYLYKKRDRRKLGREEKGMVKALSVSLGYANDSATDPDLSRRLSSRSRDDMFASSNKSSPPLLDSKRSSVSKQSIRQLMGSSNSSINTLPTSSSAPDLNLSSRTGAFHLPELHNRSSGSNSIHSSTTATNSTSSSLRSSVSYPSSKPDAASGGAPATLTLPNLDKPGAGTGSDSRGSVASRTHPYHAAQKQHIHRVMVQPIVGGAQPASHASLVFHSSRTDGPPATTGGGHPKSLLSAASAISGAIPLSLSASLTHMRPPPTSNNANGGAGGGVEKGGGGGHHAHGGGEGKHGHGFKGHSQGVDGKQLATELWKLYSQRR
ncbi:hypothetical protein HDU96_003754 [Phlyctochytrium bullatum]|nr:hypothetical protein HDU96_003754 [Phlyctochytrium bullatum]